MYLNNLPNYLPCSIIILLVKDQAPTAVALRFQSVSMEGGSGLTSYISPILRRRSIHHLQHHHKHHRTETDAPEPGLDEWADYVKNGVKQGEKSGAGDEEGMRGKKAGILFAFVGLLSWVVWFVKSGGRMLRELLSGGSYYKTTQLFLLEILEPDMRIDY